MFHYVYRLRSLSSPNQVYTGRTTDLETRLKKHNAREVPHTVKFTPWQIEVAVAFRGESKAIAFEAYLKSGSGREFALRHF